MAIIDEKKPPPDERGRERVMSSAASATSSSAPSYTPLPKFEPTLPAPPAKLSKYQNQNRRNSAYGPPSEHQCTCREKRGGFTYPGVIAYTTNILSIFAILVFAAYVVKSYEALQSLTSSSSQTADALQQLNDRIDSLLLQNEAGKLANLVAVCRDEQNSLVTSGVFGQACKALPTMLSNMNIVEVLGVPSPLSTTTVTASTQNFSSAFSTSSIFPSTTATVSASSTNAFVSSTFVAGGSSFPTADAGQTYATYFADGTSSTTTGAVSFGIIVGGVGAVVVMLGITGGIIYERAARRGAFRH